MKIIQNTITEASINQIVKSDVSRLIKFSALKEEPLCWIDGILFHIIEFEGEEVVNKQMLGKLFFSTFAFADCREKPDSLKFNGFPVEVIDLTGYSMYADLVRSILEAQK